MEYYYKGGETDMGRKRKSKTYKKFGWANRKAKQLKRQKKRNVGIRSNQGRHKVSWDE